eukprot:4458828-Alexandrium_andersonii.AAC.1
MLQLGGPQGCVSRAGFPLLLHLVPGTGSLRLPRLESLASVLQPEIRSLCVRRHATAYRLGIATGAPSP